MFLGVKFENLFKDLLLLCLCLLPLSTIIIIIIIITTVYLSLLCIKFSIFVDFNILWNHLIQAQIRFSIRTKTKK